MSNTRVTIGIPAYNRPEGLKKAIASVLAQTYGDFVIIVSDDASPFCDLTSQMRLHGISDARIKYFRQKKNIGSEANFKFVLAEATTEYFAWLADDDTIEVNFLKTLVSVLDADESIALAMCDVTAVRSRTGDCWVERLTALRSDLDWPTTRNLLFSDLRLNTFYCLYGLYRSSLLKKIKFRVNSRWKKYNTDWEVPFLASLATKGRIVSINEVLKTYYFNEDSVYHKEKNTMTAFDRIILNFDLIFRLSGAALSSSLPPLDRVRLALSPWLVNLDRLSKKIVQKYR